MIDNLEWAVDVLSGGYHARIKGTNKSYWITPHAAGFHEWTWEIFVGAAVHQRGFLTWAETLDDAKTIAEHHYAATAQGKALVGGARDFRPTSSVWGAYSASSVDPGQRTKATST